MRLPRSPYLRRTFHFLVHCLAVAFCGPAARALETEAAAIPHWAYQPLQRTEPGQVKDAEWPRGRIDRYILAALEAKGCAPAPDAKRRVLERRVAFDLTGLPPVPGETDELAADGSPEAFTRLVDRLLASPRFGERWGRHWLDVARYGESVGLRGLIFTEAWRYRDYVIDAFNRDVPFTDFVEEQIAGDLLPHASLEERRRRLPATGFLALGNTNLEEQDKKLLDMDVVDEQLDTIGKAFLAQTIGCARCHDHKFDPISTREYYAMAGILRSTRTLIHANVSSWIDAPLPLEPVAEKPYAAHEAAVAALEAEVQAARKVAATIVAARDLPGIVIDCAQARAVGEWKHSQQLKRYVLGINHESLSYRFDGRNFRLTDVYGRVVSEIVG